MKVQEGGLDQGPKVQGEDATDLFARYSASVYRYCLRRLRSPEEAEDALQVTYLNAWRSLKRGFEPRNPRPWLFQIASNVCASLLRAKLSGTRVELRDPSVLDELSAASDRAGDELLGLSEALRDLPSRQRRALVLRDWQGLSYDEIATEMAVSESAVETLLFRARRKVATALTNGEWRGKAASSASAVLVWPFAFLRTKSAATVGAGHLKTGLVLAGGTVAPLVAFGLVQLLLLNPAQTTEAHGKSANRAGETPRAPVSWLEDGRLPHVASAERVVDPKDADGHDRPTHRGHSRRGRSNPTADGASAPSASLAPKIVLCHGTASETQAGVTIDVSKNALAGLGDDARQACG